MHHVQLLKADACRLSAKMDFDFFPTVSLLFNLKIVGKKQNMCGVCIFN